MTENNMFIPGQANKPGLLVADQVQYAQVVATPDTGHDAMDGQTEEAETDIAVESHIHCFLLD